MEASGFGFSTQSLPIPNPENSTLLPFPPDYYLSVGTTAVKSRKKKGREKISDRTASLQKLMPGNKRLKTADMLEEAYKYVKFLEAQVRALHSMPLISNLNPHSHLSHHNDYGVLGLLNRQQLLQVLLNSPSIQNFLYSQGLCVCSLEQLFAFHTSA